MRTAESVLAQAKVRQIFDMAPFNRFFLKKDRNGQQKDKNGLAGMKNKCFLCIVLTALFILVP